MRCTCETANENTEPDATCNIAKTGETTHCKILTKTLKLTTYPVVWRFFTKTLFQLKQRLLENVIGPYLFRFRFLRRHAASEWCCVSKSEYEQLLAVDNP